MLPTFVRLFLITAVTCIYNLSVLGQTYPQTELENDFKSIEQQFNVSVEDITLKDFTSLAKKYSSEKYDGDKREIALISLTRRFHWKRGDVLNLLNENLKLYYGFFDEMSEEERLTLLSTMAHGYTKLKNYSLSNHFLYESLNYTEEDKHDILAHIGNNFILLNIQDSAIHVLQEAQQYPTTTIKQLDDINSLGFAHFKKGDFKSAQTFYEQVMHEYHQSSKIDSSVYYNALSNLASVYIKTGHYTRAEDCLERIKKSWFYQNNELIHFTVEIQLKEFQVAFNLGKNTQRYYESLVLAAQKDTTNKAASALHESELRNAILNGDNNAAQLALNKLIARWEQSEMEHELLNLNSQKLFLLGHTNHVNQLNAHLTETLEQKKSLKEANSQLRLWFTITVGLSLLISILLFVVSRLQRKKKELIHLNEEARLKQEKLELKQLINYADEKVNLFEEISSKLRSIIDSNQKEDDISSLIHFIKSYSNSESLKKFILSSKDVEQELQFKERFSKRHSDLTTSDLQLVILIRLGMSNKEISAFKNVEHASVRTFKNRLKNKLNIESGTSLDNYIREF